MANANNARTLTILVVAFSVMSYYGNLYECLFMTQADLVNIAVKDRHFAESTDSSVSLSLNVQ
jgi:hypothetical protein